MSTNDWKREMDRLMELFEHEATSSLRKILQCFELLGRPFDENFHQYFMRRSSSRLDSSFNTVLMEIGYDNPIQMTPSTSTSNNHNELASNLNILCSGNGTPDLLNASQCENVLQLKTESCDDAPTEYYCSSDEEVDDEQLTQAAYDALENRTVSNASSPELIEGNENNAIEHGSIDSVKENDIAIDVKRELKVEIVDETVDLPLITFDPNRCNECLAAANAGNMADSLNEENQASSSSNTTKPSQNDIVKRFKCNKCHYACQYKSHLERHQLIHKAIKPFKCEHCDYAALQKGTLIRHKKIHARQELMNVTKDPNDGLYKCTHCDQRFTKWESIQLHLKKSHKNNQRLFNCGRCLRGFARKSEKERHELRCQNRRYECYLCKYVAKKNTHIERHMRTHSGAKPFECAICSKCFRLKGHLKYHLDSTHSRISK